MSNSILRMVNVSKTFPGVKALDNISFTVERGEIHALVGENGAGKSTLIKILAGIHQPDGGEIYVEDELVKMTDVNVASSLGIRVIHQELSLATNMTVAENIYMGHYPLKKNKFIDDKKMNSDTEKLLESLGMKDLKPAMRVSNLSVAQQQMVEICRSLSQDIKLLIMDEPTASLANEEVDVLLDIMKKLKDSGVTVVFISHKLGEVFRSCDKITVLRDGQVIGTRATQDMTYNQLISMMVGREIENIYPEHTTTPKEVFFEANGINSARVHDISFNLKKGEVLGFYGLMGSGRSEVFRALLGIDKNTKQEIKLDGAAIKIEKPADATKVGIVLAPEDRKHEGLILMQTVDFNITITIIKKLIKGIRLNKKLNDETVGDISKRLRVKAPSSQAKALNLSGGNQQKVVLAKWLVTNPKILILDEPTKGIDVGAKQEIYKLIYEIVDMGVGVILISSEMPEVLNLCDRVYVLREGRLVGEVQRADLNEETVIKYAVGGIGNE